MSEPFDPEQLLACYRRGVFPMADGREDRHVFLMEPEMRGIIPLDGLKISRSMRQFLRRHAYTVTYNQAFADVIEACALTRTETWISEGIEMLYTVLHEQGDAHSVEVWEVEKLVGGLYGVTQGGAFFGESMFSLRTNVSKLALVKLVERLNERGFVLLDTQFLTDHLKTLGAIEIARDEYKDRLTLALGLDASFAP
ncbi:leucyl/phenylalanyl-tRNA--protein transferase [Litorimonas sp. RW-G-Af-16]|uniref:leucyl/phenylalanyl-tRNA--protein transferase n=1 Tax=Litorimonas sp. RW-G-Af-16 TaxID=3241168 RepID=UPI003AAFB589